MDEIWKVHPENVATLATFFANGYLFRRTVLRMRNVRAEGEIHTVVMGVVTSVFLWVLLSSSPLTVPESFKAYRLPIYVGSNLAASIALGWVWGNVPAWLERVGRPSFHNSRGWKLLIRLVGHFRAQAVPRFLDSTRNRIVRLELTSGVWYQGMVEYYDLDPERYGDLHVSLVYVHIWDEKTKVWVPLHKVDRVLLCLKDVKGVQSCPAES